MAWTPGFSGSPSIPVCRPKNTGIAHLAEAGKLQHEQIWDYLNRQGFSSTVWGAMNGKNNHHSLMKTFFPDPWTYSEIAAPDELNRLLALPRMYAQHYGQIRTWEFAKCALKTGSYLLTRQLVTVLRNLKFWTGPALTSGFNNTILFALFDNLSAKLFRRFCEQDKSDFKLIFLNSIAHLQHHAWQPDSKKTQAAIRLLDDTLATALQTAQKGEPVLVANAFSQVYTADRNEFLYRPIDPQALISAFGLPHSHVEQMMTNDGHIFFRDADSCEQTLSALAAAAVDGSKAFDVDRRGETQLFYQFRIWGEVPEDSVIEVNQLSLRFYDLFEKLVRRTGSHTSEGDVFYTNIELPEKIWNHDLFHLIKESYV